MDSQGNPSPGYSGDVNSSSSDSRKHGHHLKETLKHDRRHLKKTLKDAFDHDTFEYLENNRATGGGVTLTAFDEYSINFDTDEFIPLSMSQEEKLHDSTKYEDTIVTAEVRRGSISPLPDDDEVEKKRYEKTKWPLLPSDEEKEVDKHTIFGVENATIPSSTAETEKVPTIVPFISNELSDSISTAIGNRRLFRSVIDTYKEIQRKDEEDENDGQSMITEHGSTIAPNSPNPNFVIDPLQEAREHDEIVTKEKTEEAIRRVEFTKAKIDLDLREKESTDRFGFPKYEDPDAASMIVEHGSTTDLTLPENFDTHLADPYATEKRAREAHRKHAAAYSSLTRSSTNRGDNESEGVYGDDELSAGDTKIHASHIGNIPECPSKKIFKEASATVKHDNTVDKAVEPLSTMLTEHFFGTDIRSNTITPNPPFASTGPLDPTSTKYTDKAMDQVKLLAGMTQGSPDNAPIAIEGDNSLEDDAIHLKDPNFVAQSTRKYVSDDEEETDDEYRAVPVRSIFKIKGVSVRPGPTLGNEYATAKPLPIRDPVVIENEREDERIKLLAELQTPIEKPFPLPTAIEGEDGKFRCSDPRCSKTTYKSVMGCNVAIPNHHFIPTSVGRPVNDILSIKPLTEKDRLALLELYKKSIARAKEWDELSRIGNELERGNIREYFTPYRSTGIYLMNNIGQMQTEIDPDFEYDDSDKENVSYAPPYKIDSPEKEGMALEAFRDELPPYDIDYDEFRSPLPASEKEQLEVSTPKDENVESKSTLIEAARGEHFTVINSRRNVLSEIFNTGKSIILDDNADEAAPQDADDDKKPREKDFTGQVLSGGQAFGIESSDKKLFINETFDDESSGKFPLYIDLTKEKPFEKKIEIVGAAREKHAKVVQSKKNEGVLPSPLSVGKNIIPGVITEEEASHLTSDVNGKSSGKGDPDTSPPKDENTEKKTGLVNSAREDFTTVTDVAHEGIPTAIDTVASAIINAGKTIAPVGIFNSGSGQKDLEANVSGAEDNEEGGVRLNGDEKDE